MPIIQDNGNGTFQWIADNNSASKPTYISSDERMQQVRALPSDVNVVRTDNPPPAPYSLGRPDQTISPVWPVKIETADRYNYSPEFRRRLYDTNVSYDTFHEMPAQNPEQNGPASYYNRLSGDIHLGQPYWTDLGAERDPYSPGPSYDAVHSLEHEFMHSQQDSDQGIKQGERDMRGTPYYDRGLQIYHPRMLQRILNWIDPGTLGREAHAEMSTYPELLADADREKYYPGVYQMPEAPLPPAQPQWNGPW